MTLPNLLLVDVRLAFQTCARQHRTSRGQSRHFRTVQPLFKRGQPRSSKQVTPPPSLGASKKDNVLPARDPSEAAPQNVPMNDPASSRQLVPDSSKPTSVTGRNRTDVPMKIIPKAQITPELTLTPKEQLQIEFMTRRPPRTEAKKSGSRTEWEIETQQLTPYSLQRSTAHIPWWASQDQFPLNRQDLFSASYVWFHFRYSASLLCIRITLVDHSTAYVPITSNIARC